VIGFIPILALCLTVRLLDPHALDDAVAADRRAWVFGARFAPLIDLRIFRADTGDDLLTGLVEELLNFAPSGWVINAVIEAGPGVSIGQRSWCASIKDTDGPALAKIAAQLFWVWASAVTVIFDALEELVTLLCALHTVSLLLRKGATQASAAIWRETTLRSELADLIALVGYRLIIATELAEFVGDTVEALHKPFARQVGCFVEEFVWCILAPLTTEPGRYDVVETLACREQTHVHPATETITCVITGWGRGWLWPHLTGVWSTWVRRLPRVRERGRRRDCCISLGLIPVCRDGPIERAAAPTIICCISYGVARIDWWPCFFDTPNG
jgi:hypothetical protein